VSLGEEPAAASWDVTGVHGLHRPRVWDAVLSVDAPEVAGDVAAFVALASGDLVVEEGPDQLEPLAAAIERELAPPYRAEAVRRDGGLWAVAARSVQLVELPGAPGTEVEVTSHGGERTLVVDGERSFGSLPALERPGHVARAKRLDGDTWEVTFDRL
jgi:hypothetical protein